MINIYFKNSLILIIFISLLVVFSSGFVGAQNNNEVFENLKLPSDVEGLVKSFSYMNYDLVVLRNGEKVQDSTIEYDYLGKEDIKNVETDKVSFNMSDSLNNDMPTNMLFWFDGTDIKKMEIDGEEISAQMAGVMGDRLLSAIFSPFYSLSEYNLEELKKIGKVSQSQEMFGGENIDVTTIEVNNIPEYEIETGTVKLGKYNEMSFVIRYEYVSSTEDLKVTFDVNNIEFH